MKQNKSLDKDVLSFAYSVIYSVIGEPKRSMELLLDAEVSLLCRGRRLESLEDWMEELQEHSAFRDRLFSGGNLEMSFHKFGSQCDRPDSNRADSHGSDSYGFGSFWGLPPFIRLCLFLCHEHSISPEKVSRWFRVSDRLIESSLIHGRQTLLGGQNFETRESDSKTEH